MKKLFSIGLALSVAQLTLADQQQTHWAISHAPIGVMGDHTHQQDDWMFSYRYMNMSMLGLRQGTKDLTTTSALQDFMLVPVNMDMEMHMLGAMYAPTDKITLMAMLNYHRQDMLIQNRMGNRFRTQSDGVGDSHISALVGLNNWKNNHLHLNIGISIPTGSINPRDNTPMGPDSLLPYPMRLGSGTYDMNVGLTWNQYSDEISMGAQWLSTIRTGENSQDYRLGHENKINFWVAKPMTQSWSLSGRLEAKNRQSIKGSDARLMMMTNMTPTADANNSGGDWLTLNLGLNYVSNANNWTNGHRLAIEFSRPIIQDLAGTQMKSTNSFTIGWQKAF